MKLKLQVLTAVLLMAATTLFAEEGSRPPGPPGGKDQHGGPRPPQNDPMKEYLYPPDFIMHQADEIGLTDEQRQAIEDEMQSAKPKFDDLHKKVKGEMDGLVNIVKQPHVDEAQARAQLDKVLAAESEIKKAHMTLMIHIKNQLTPEQQTKLNEMKKHMPPPPGGGGPRESGGDRRPPPPRDGEDSGPDDGPRRKGSPSDE